MKNYIKENWFKIILFFVIILLGFLFYKKIIKLNNDINSEKNITKLLIEETQELRTAKEDLESRIKTIEIENLIDGIIENNVIDPYNQNFSDINEEFSILINDIKEYGSGTKINFTVLNKSGIEYRNIKFNFQLRDSVGSEDFNILETKEHEITEKILSGYSRDSEIIFSNTPPDLIKGIKVAFSNGQLYYYQH